MNQEELVRKLAKASGLAEPRCEEMVGYFFAALSTCVKSSAFLNIDGFGIFRRYRQGVDKSPARIYFIPSKKLLDRCSTAPLAVGPVEKPVKSSKPNYPLRREDADIIRKWLETRQGLIEANVTENLIFDENPAKQAHYRTIQTVATARKAVQKFARHTSVPLLEIGLNPDSSGIYERADLRKEVLNYAAIYQKRNLPILIAKMHEKDNRNPIQLVFRTQGWFKFVRYTRDFFNWCIEQGYRPKGSNPFDGIKLQTPLSNGKVLIHREWYKQVLRYPNMKPRERAVLYLLATGLRASECSNLRLEDLDLKNKTLIVHGKGWKVRPVKLPWWTLEAIDAHLQTRRNPASPWMFPSHIFPDKPINYMQIRNIVNRIAAKTFPRYEDLHKRRKIKAHGFRRFYATQRLDSGGSIMVTMDQTGHSSFDVYKTYVTVDDKLRDREHKKITKKKWW